MRSLSSFFFFLRTRLQPRWENFSLLFIVRSYFFQRRELGALIEGLKKLFLRSEEQYPLFLGMLSSLSCGILEMQFEESILPLLFDLYSHRPKLSTNQRARIRSVIVKFAIVHRLDNKVRESFVLKTGFSSYIRDPADKMRFFQAYTDITGLGKKMQMVRYRSVEAVL